MSVLTDRQREILALLNAGNTAAQTAKILGISRNAVHQQIQRMRNSGVLARDYTPSGQPMRETQPGALAMSRILDNLKQPEKDEDVPASQLAALALDQLRQVRDELDVIAARITTFIPR